VNCRHHTGKETLAEGHKPANFQVGLKSTACRGTRTPDDPRGSRRPKAGPAGENKNNNLSERDMRPSVVNVMDCAGKGQPWPLDGSLGPGRLSISYVLPPEESVPTATMKIITNF
jgi:hypothetical protein